MYRERVRRAIHGLVMIPIILAIAALGTYALVQGARGDGTAWIVGGLVVQAVATVMLFGLFIVAPNQGLVLQLFGEYKGTVRDAGLRWANPFFTAKPVSLRTRNFESAKLKVNDNHGNPVEIAAVVVWQVVDTAEAMFVVDNYENFVHVQSESALRNMASGYAYDAHVEGEVSLRANTALVAEKLREEIQDRLSQAGVKVMEARISHLAYAQEIAHAMLQRQQASAIIAARQKIVEGAVGMVEMALEMLSTRSIVELDEERKAAMVSNLLVVLCSDRGTQPIVNAGSLHH